LAEIIFYHIHGFDDFPFTSEFAFYNHLDPP
jgi:hypothetical protein